MGSYYEDRGELISTDDDSFTLNDTKYRISVRVRHKDYYVISAGLYKIQGTTPHDRLDSKTFRTRRKEEVQKKVEEGVDLMRESAEEREDAKQLNVSVEVTEDE